MAVIGVENFLSGVIFHSKRGTVCGSCGDKIFPGKYFVKMRIGKWMTSICPVCVISLVQKLQQLNKGGV